MISSAKVQVEYFALRKESPRIAFSETGNERNTEAPAAMLLPEARMPSRIATRGDGDWTGEDEAKASLDAMREVAICSERKPSEWQNPNVFLKAAQAESERCEQRDNLLRVLQHITCEPINAEYMAQEAIDAIVADEINKANGGAVCRMTANAGIQARTAWRRRMNC